MRPLSFSILSALVVLIANCSALVNPAAGGHLANLLEIRQVVPPPPPGPGGSGSGGGGGSRFQRHLTTVQSIAPRSAISTITAYRLCTQAYFDSQYLCYSCGTQLSGGERTTEEYGVEALQNLFGRCEREGRASFTTQPGFSTYTPSALRTRTGSGSRSTATPSILPTSSLSRATSTTSDLGNEGNRDPPVSTGTATTSQAAGNVAGGGGGSGGAFRMGAPAGTLLLTAGFTMLGDLLLWI